MEWKNVWKNKPIMGPYVAISGTGEIIATNDGKNTYLLDRGEMQWSSVGREGLSALAAVDISISGEYLVSAHGKIIRCFDRKGKMLWKHLAKAEIGDVAVSNLGEITYFSSGATFSRLNNGSQLVWRKRLGAPLLRYIYGLTTSKDGEHIVIGSNDKRIYFFDEDGQKLWEYKTKGSIGGVGISDKGEYAVGASADKSVYLLNNEGKLLWKRRVARGFKSYLRDVAISNTGDYIVVGADFTPKNDLFVFNREGELLWKTRIGNYRVGLGGNVQTVDISTDGKYIAVGSADKNLYLFERV